MSGESGHRVHDRTQKQRILIIEDHPSTLNLLGEVVEQAGYEAVLASGGAEGLRLLREGGGVDLILLDLMMDDMDGWTVLEIIEADEDIRPLPVIIVTARHQFQEERWIEAHAGLFKSYLMKPFRVDELLAEIEAVLQ